MKPSIQRVMDRYAQSLAREAVAERGGEPEPEWETITIDDGQGTFVRGLTLVEVSR